MGSESDGSHQEPRYTCNQPRLLAVLIHEVMPDAECLAKDDGEVRGKPWREALHSRRIFFHKSYVRAALELYTCIPPVFSAAQLRRVAAKAIEDFDELRLSYPDWGERWEGPERSLRHELGEVDKVLRS